MYFALFQALAGTCGHSRVLLPWSMSEDAAQRQVQPVASASLLAGLLMDIFSPQECINFLGRHYPALRHQLALDPVPAQFFDAAALTLYRHGLANNNLTVFLVKERPARTPDILRVMDQADVAGRTASNNRLEFSFSGTLSELDIDRLLKTIEFLRTITCDETIVIVRVSSGSIKVLLESSANGLQLLNAMDIEDIAALLKKRGMELIAIDATQSPSEQFVSVRSELMQNELLQNSKRRKERMRAFELLCHFSSEEWAKLPEEVIATLIRQLNLRMGETEIRQFVLRLCSTHLAPAERMNALKDLNVAMLAAIPEPSLAGKSGAGGGDAA